MPWVPASLLAAVFAPEGWPESVAPEYGRYQLWDTIQQATLRAGTWLPFWGGTKHMTHENESGLKKTS